MPSKAVTSDEGNAYARAAAQPVLVVTGPTATGKTALAVALCRRFGGEVVSVDSRQVYRGLDLGTGKDLAEYGDGADAVPHHLIDVADPGEKFDLHRFVQLAREAIVDIRRRGRLPVLCGGTPLYLTALLRGYALEGGAPDPAERARLEALDTPALLAELRACAPPALLARTDTTQRRRIVRAIEIARSGPAAEPPPPLANTLVLAPLFTRAEVRERIRLRLEQRLEAGMVAEVARLHENGLSWEALDWLGLEYRFIARHLAGQLSHDEMHDQLLNHIRQFAKRQDIWFRRLEREGLKIHWLHHGDIAEAIQLAQEWLSNS